MAFSQKDIDIQNPTAEDIRQLILITEREGEKIARLTRALSSDARAKIPDLSPKSRRQNLRLIKTFTVVGRLIVKDNLNPEQHKLLNSLLACIVKNGSSTEKGYPRFGQIRARRLDSHPF